MVHLGMAGAVKVLGTIRTEFILEMCFPTAHLYIAVGIKDRESASEEN